MTHRLTHAIAAAMLVSGPAFAQEVMVATAAPPANVGLIEALSEREGALSMVSERLSRIDTNIEIGTRPGGVLARLAAAAGPDGWPAGAYDPDVLSAIDDWRLSVNESLANPIGSDRIGSDPYDIGPALPPDWAHFERPETEAAEQSERPVLTFFLDGPPPAFVAPAFHDVFPLTQISGGFFSAH